MKPDERNIEEVLQRSLPSAPREQMESALERIHARLQSDRGETVSDRFVHVDSRAVGGPVASKRWRGGGWWIPVMSGVAALVVAAVWTGVSERAGQGGGNRGIYAVLETRDDALYRITEANRVLVRAGERIGAQEIVRSNGAGAVLALGDGSRVEMRAQSELSLERADDGMRIRLRSGSIIVNAAKRPSGHLYVETKDVIVSVVGTIFLVNAETDGSRVAVIEGEVRVHEGKTETRLHPGEQVSSSPTLAARTVPEEIAWSRQANAHLAILEAFTKGMAATAGPLTRVADRSASANAAAGQAGAAARAPEFEEASIRPCDPDNVPAPPAGARGGGVNSFQMTPGRTHALCMTLATLIRTALGYGPAQLEFLTGGGIGPGRRGLAFNNVYGLGVEDGRRVRGGPDWVRSERYTIEAVADAAATAEEMRGAMLRALLEKRFQLKTHVEIEQIPAFNLTIARSGLKIKPVEASDAVDARGFVNATVSSGGACEAQPRIPPGGPAIIRPAQPGERQPPPPSTPGQPVTVLFRNFVDVRRGEKPTCGVSVQRNGPNQVIVAGGISLEALGRALASPLGGVTVYDKTSNTDKFNVVLEFVRDENTPGPSFLTPDQPEPSNVPRGQTIFTALEEQLGLKLEPARAPREFIVIDRVERPSPN